MKFSRNYRILPFLILLVLLCSCAKKTIQPTAPAQTREIADILDIPQNLEIFAKHAGSEKHLLSMDRQDALNARFDNIWFGPWEMRKTTISPREVRTPFARARGYKSDGFPWTQPEWENLKTNARLASFPSHGLPGITVRPTDLRELPTHEPNFSKPTPDPKKDPFDNFQYSFLPVGMPLLIVHTTRDGAWHYVECPIAGGWVDAKDIAQVDEAFKSLWRRGVYAALTRDNVILPGLGKNGSDIKAGIGAILPCVNRRANQLQVLAPVKDAMGMSATVELSLSRNDAVIKPLPLTPGNVAKIGNEMMGQPYGWGGMFGRRDCSAMLRDLFAPFGLWLPRNSSSQAKMGAVVPLAGMGIREKEAIILRDGLPFLSLVGLPGHIALYVGSWKNRPAIFHNAWGLRIVKDDNDDERFVIGRAVITSISPGMELPNLYRTRTFGDRVRSLNTPGY